MAACAGSSAHLPMVDAIAQRNHRRCSSFGNGKLAGRSRTCVWMRSLWRLCGGFHGFTHGSRRTRAWSCGRGAASNTTLIHNPIDPAAYVVGNIERSIRAHGKAGRTMRGAGGILVWAGETVGKNLTSARCAFTLERLENHVIAALRVRRAIP